LSKSISPEQTFGIKWRACRYDRSYPIGIASKLMAGDDEATVGVGELVKD
jgi:hypothetical protein